MFAAALFDLDGTLIDTEPRSRAAWAKLFARHGVPVTESTLRSFAGRPGKEVLREHLALFPGLTVEELAAEAVGYTAGADMPEVREVPGALALVARLHRAGIPLGVVTSAPRSYAHHELRRIGVLDLLDVVITADDVTRGKPDPEGCLSACASLNADPATVVVFEDAPAGITAAKRAGTHCVAVTTTEPPSALSAADLILPDFTTLPWPPPFLPTPRTAAADLH
ncbi:HAD family hydrolase [Streptomyces sp. NPDC015346]|uniref:HAD family hydrolase n=1 Tax=Streptomyces sp. NPDC015346 TaxID=3364954 RepID=UPI0036F75341